VADLANLQPEYQGVPTAAADMLAGEFRSQLHSAYLYGSVARGNAVPGRSDIDLLAVLLAAPVDEDRGRAERVERALTERFPVLFSAGVGLTHLQEVRSPAQRYGLQVFLRELAVCICGEDLRPGLPRTKPSAAVAAGFHDDTVPPSPVRAKPWAPRPIPRSSGASAGRPREGWCRWRSRS
jgi:predicted nucleotidyltransferase